MESFRNPFALVLPILLAALGCGLFEGASDWGAKRMDVYSQALDVAQGSSDVTEKIGPSLAVGWPVRLSRGLTDQGNDVEMEIPISGRISSGYIHVLGKKQSGVWMITNLYVTQRLASGVVTTIYKK